MLMHQNISLLLSLLSLQRRGPGRFDATAIPPGNRNYHGALHLLKAFEAGADAVFVAGCHEGECHYLTGNIKAKKRVNKLKKDLAQMGIEPERLEMFNLGSAEGPRFAAICQEMTDRAYKLSLSPIKGGG